MSDSHPLNKSGATNFQAVVADPHLTPAQIKEILTAPNHHACEQFLQHFSHEVEELTLTLSQAHARFVGINPRVPQDQRSGWTQAFLYSAFDCLVSSAQLLIFGHLLAAGNLMRGWGEAVAMALLCSSDRVAEFDRFIVDPMQHATHKAIDRLGNKKTLKTLDVDPDGLNVLKQINAFYNEHSHTSAWAVASRGMQQQSGMLILAGEFDPAKLDYYERELTLLRSACDRLVEVMVVVEQNLLNRTR